MPDQRKLTETVAQVGKQALASDTGQVVVGAVAEKVQELALARAEDVSHTIQEKAAKAAGRKPPRRQVSRATTKQTEASPLSTIKDKAGDAASAVASGPENVSSGVKKVGAAGKSVGKKAAEAVTEIPAPVIAAATGAAVLGGAALARERLQKKKQKSAAKKSAAKKSRAKKSAAKKSPAKKAGSKRTAAKRTAAKRTAAKRTAAKRTGAKRTGAKRTGAKRSPRQEDRDQEDRDLEGEEVSHANECEQWEVLRADEDHYIVRRQGNDAIQVGVVREAVGW